MARLHPQDLAGLAEVAAARGADVPGSLTWEPSTFQVDSGGPIDVGMDGETLRTASSLRFSIRPGYPADPPSPGRGPALTAARLSARRGPPAFPHPFLPGLAKVTAQGPWREMVTGCSFRIHQTDIRVR